SQGVNPNLVSAQGFGDADPVASNATPEGRAQNRRVEVTLANSGS
ncbi:MAG: OmpA/MotB family protein, partial [Candidatus Binataceae bacterium]